MAIAWNAYYRTLSDARKFLISCGRSYKKGEAAFLLITGIFIGISIVMTIVTAISFIFKCL
nr:MAG TPA: Endothelial cell-specific chemotaxis regulator [Caudoviricetes sp.]